MLSIDVSGLSIIGTQFDKFFRIDYKTTFLFIPLMKPNSVLLMSLPFGGLTYSSFYLSPIPSESMLLSAAKIPSLQSEPDLSKSVSKFSLPMPGQSSTVKKSLPITVSTEYVSTKNKTMPTSATAASIENNSAAAVPYPPSTLPTSVSLSFGSPVGNSTTSPPLSKPLEASQSQPPEAEFSGSRSAVPTYNDTVIDLPTNSTAARNSVTISIPPKSSVIHPNVRSSVVQSITYNVYNSQPDVVYNSTSDVVYNSTLDVVYNSTLDVVYNSTSDVANNSISSPNNPGVVNSDTLQESVGPPISQPSTNIALNYNSTTSISYSANPSSSVPPFGLSESNHSVVVSIADDGHSVPISLVLPNNSSHLSAITPTMSADKLSVPLSEPLSMPSVDNQRAIDSAKHSVPMPLQNLSDARHSDFESNNAKSMDSAVVSIVDDRHSVPISLLLPKNSTHLSVVTPKMSADKHSVLLSAALPKPPLDKHSAINSAKHSVPMAVLNLSNARHSDFESDKRSDAKSMQLLKQSNGKLDPQIPVPTPPKSSDIKHSALKFDSVAKQMEKHSKSVPQPKLSVDKQSVSRHDSPIFDPTAKTSAFKRSEAKVVLQPQQFVLKHSASMVPAKQLTDKHSAASVDAPKPNHESAPIPDPIPPPVVPDPTPFASMKHSILRLISMAKQLSTKLNVTIPMPPPSQKDIKPSPVITSTRRMYGRPDNVKRQTMRPLMPSVPLASKKMANTSASLSRSTLPSDINLSAKMNMSHLMWSNETSFELPSLLSFLDSASAGKPQRPTVGSPEPSFISFPSGPSIPVLAAIPKAALFEVADCQPCPETAVGFDPFCAKPSAEPMTGSDILKFPNECLFHLYNCKNPTARKYCRHPARHINEIPILSTDCCDNFPFQNILKYRRAISVIR